MSKKDKKYIDLAIWQKRQGQKDDPPKDPAKRRKSDVPKNPPPSSKEPHAPEKRPYFLPLDTWRNVQPFLGLKKQQIDNFALLLNKCVLYDYEDSKRKKKNFLLLRKEERKRDKIVMPAYRITPMFAPARLQTICARHRTAIENLGLKLVAPKFKVDWRLIVGLGNESVYETSMTLHHIYGIPYIPGQAVKGVTRSWMLATKFNHDETQAMQKSKVFCDIFGCTADSVYNEARQGKVVFFDAFPVDLKPEHIQPDIMNPHYGPYYVEGKPPADYHNPVPVNFLTVTGATFEFFLGIKSEKDESQTDPFFTEAKPLLERTKNYLIEALQEHGIGAKTAVGYGYFSDLNQ